MREFETFQQICFEIALNKTCLERENADSVPEGQSWLKQLPNGGICMESISIVSIRLRVFGSGLPLGNEGLTKRLIC